MITAQEVMDRSAALLNDVALTTFTYTVQVPYLNIALSDLEERMQLSNIPVTNQSSAVIAIPAGVLGIGGVGQPALPQDLIEPQSLYERTTGTNDLFIRMNPVEFLPHGLQQISSLVWWAWLAQTIKFIGATNANDVQLDYIAKVITPVVNESSVIKVLNSISFLSYRTAALCAEFIGENKERADDLNGNALIALDNLLGINIKGKQSIMTRRRPFLASFKLRGY